MKKLNKVEMSLAQDDSNGVYGFFPKGTCDCDSPFNAVSDIVGLIHDVFEHNHEFTDYFSGDNALNMGGEIAAMGKALYVYEQIGVRRGIGRFRSGSEDIERTVREMLWSHITEHQQYGQTLECGVPTQQEHYGSWEYEHIYNMAQRIWVYVASTDLDEIKNDPHKEESDYEAAKTYYDSISSDKIADLLIWGYRNLESKLRKDSYNHVLYSFIDFWSEFLAYQELEELLNFGFTDLTICWNCERWTGRLSAPGLNVRDTVFNHKSNPKAVISRIHSKTI